MHIFKHRRKIFLENVSMKILGKDAHSRNFLGNIYENMYESTNLVLGKKAA